MTKTVILILAVCAFCIFGTVFLPPQFETQGILLTDELLLLLGCGLIFFLFQQKKWPLAWLGALVSVTLFIIPVFRLWQTAESSWNVVLGLFPWSDSTWYYLDANRLLIGDSFSTFSGRRPFFAGFLSILLALTNHNLQTVLVIFAILVGVSAFVLASEVEHLFGPLAGTLVLLLAQFFYRPFAGILLTEQLGFPAGLFAFAVLLHGIRNQKMWLFAAGVSIVTFALFARAGAFFILPFIFMYGVFQFGKNTPQRMKAAAIIAFFAFIPIVSNLVFGKILASQDATQFGNFADTLYGQTVGGKGWRQVTLDHPELAKLHEPVRTDEVYRLALEEIRNRPVGLAQGTFKAWKDFVLPGTLFEYLQVGNTAINLALQILLSIPFWVGVWFLWKDREKAIPRFFLVFLAGIFLSVPFVPPMDAGIRPYAATMAAIFLSVAYSISKFPRQVGSLELGKETSVFAGAALALPVVIFLGALLLKNTASTPSFASVQCKKGETRAIVHIAPGSSVSFVKNTTNGESHVPNVLIKDIQRSFADFPYAELSPTMRKIKKPAFVTLALDISGKSYYWVIAPPSLAEAEGHLVVLCGQTVASPVPILEVESFFTQ